MPLPGVKLCGAKCRSKGGAPCEMAATKGSGRTRCRMHGGNHYKNAKHGRLTKQAKAERRKQREFLRELKSLTS